MRRGTQGVHLSTVRLSTLLLSWLVTFPVFGDTLVGWLPAKVPKFLSVIFTISLSLRFLFVALLTTLGGLRGELGVDDCLYPLSLLNAFVFAMVIGLCWACCYIEVGRDSTGCVVWFRCVELGVCTRFYVISTVPPVGWQFVPTQNCSTTVSSQRQCIAISKQRQCIAISKLIDGIQLVFPPWRFTRIDVGTILTGNLTRLVTIMAFYYGFGGATCLCIVTIRPLYAINFIDSFVDTLFIDIPIPHLLKE